MSQRPEIDPQMIRDLAYLAIESSSQSTIEQVVTEVVKRQVTPLSQTGFFEELSQHLNWPAIIRQSPPSINSELYLSEFFKLWSPNFWTTFFRRSQVNAFRTLASQKLAIRFSDNNTLLSGLAAETIGLAAIHGNKTAEFFTETGKSSASYPFSVAMGEHLGEPTQQPRQIVSRLQQLLPISDTIRPNSAMDFLNRTGAFVLKTSSGESFICPARTNIAKWLFIGYGKMLKDAEYQKILLSTLGVR